mgnify:CR=1 FL=1
MRGDHGGRLRKRSDGTGNQSKRQRGGTVILNDVAKLAQMVEDARDL